MDDTAPYALVVDDDALIRMDAVYILEDAGFRTLEAFDVDSAIRTLEQSGDDIQLLFTDVQMREVAMGSRLPASVRADRLISRSLLHQVRRDLTTTICQTTLCS